MRYSGQLFGTKEDTKFGISWQQSGEALQHHVFSTESKGTTKMQKPGNNAKAFRLSQVVHKHWELSVFRKTWYSSPDLVIELIEKSGTSQTRACMIAPMCAYKCEHVHAYVCIYVSKWLRACVHILAGMIGPCVCIRDRWSRACVHILAGMIEHVCEYVSKWLRACVHILAGMFTPMCAYTCRHNWAYLCIYACRHDCAYLARGLVGVKIY